VTIQAVHAAPFIVIQIGDNDVPSNSRKIGVTLSSHGVNVRAIASGNGLKHTLVVFRLVLLFPAMILALG